MACFLFPRAENKPLTCTILDFLHYGSKQHPMKTLILSIFLAAATLAQASTVPSIVEQEPMRVDQYKLKQENTLWLDMQFGEDLILNREQRAKLKGHEIYRVELVYTKYRSSADFDQQALNSKRIEHLYTAMPELKNDPNISWGLIEQTGAENAEEARSFDHGFVIHYGDPMDYKSLSAALESFQTPFSEYTIRAERGGIIEHPSGTKIHFEPYSICGANGKPIRGNVTVQYREFRDQADIAFSGIPMTVEEQGENMNFSSVGMFELRAQKGDQDLTLQKPATVDFQSTGGKPGVGFYQLDDESSTWSKVKQITPGTATTSRSSALPNAGKNMPQQDMVAVAFEETGPQVRTWLEGKNRVTLTYSDEEITLSRPYGEDSTIHSSMNELVEADPQLVDRSFHKPGKKFAPAKEPRLQGTFRRDVLQSRVQQPRTAVAANQFGGPGAYVADAGHTFPAFVTGLQASGFGVYNCDQVYRLANQVSINAEYIDQASGKKIEHKQVVCVIDLMQNGSFSFHPNNFVCDATGKKALALFTQDQRLYLFSQEDFKDVKLNGNVLHTFAMRDMTDKIKGSEDLKSFLGL